LTDFHETLALLCLHFIHQFILKASLPKK